MSKTALVVSAHSADFVWRAAGAIALHAARGYAMHVVCLSYGERGESEKLWRQKGITLEQVKSARRKEAESAAKVLGVAELQFFDMGDYPMRATDEALFRLVDVYRKVRPAFVLTHSLADPYNFDHPAGRAHGAGGARHRPGARPQSGRGRDRRTAGVPVRAAPARAVRLEAQRAARHHAGLGEEARGDRVHDRSGAPVGVLHGRGAAARQPVPAQRRRQELHPRRRLPEDLPRQRRRCWHERHRRPECRRARRWPT